MIGNAHLYENLHITQLLVSTLAGNRRLEETLDAACGPSWAFTKGTGFPMATISSLCLLRTFWAIVKGASRDTRGSPTPLQRSLSLRYDLLQRQCGLRFEKNDTLLHDKWVV